MIAALVATDSASKALPRVVGLFPQQDPVYSFRQISKLEHQRRSSPCVIVSMHQCMPVSVSGKRVADYLKHFDLYWNCMCMSVCVVLRN